MNPGSDNTDRSSIKPVSSLLSKFENLPTSKVNRDNTPESATFNKPVPLQPTTKPTPPQPPTKPILKKRPPTPPAARRSFDITRPPSTPAQDDGGDDVSHRARMQSRSLRRPGSPPHARPLSMHITPTFDRAPKERSPLNCKPLEPRSVADAERTYLHPSSTGLSQSEGTVAAQQGPVGAATLSAQYRDRSSLGDPVANPAVFKQPPPPVNRAAKPAPDLLELNVKAPDDLSLNAKSPKVRSSPFSTPPSNDEGNTIANDPPPVPMASRPLAPPSNNPFNQEQHPGTYSIASYQVRPPRVSSRISNVNEHNRRRSKSNNAAVTDKFELGPTLPPRRQMPSSDALPASTILSTSATRQSFDDSKRPSALTQGFSARPFPPRGDSQASGPFQGRPHRVSERRISATPPPRKGPEAHFNKSFMKSSPVLTDSAPGDPPIGLSTARASAQGVWPNSSRANRRPPCHRDGPHSINTGHDTRLMDACGDFVCTSGTTTRAWHIPSGKLLCSLAHPEGTKVTALAFKPARDIDMEGQFVWLGTNFGELMELELSTRSITAVNERMHSRREIVRMFRNATEIWTLDSEGKFFVWPCNENGAPSLERGIFNGRASRDVTSSVVVGSRVWLATKKSLNVFQPNAEPDKMAFEVTPDPIPVLSVGDITSSAYVPNNQDQVFFGHSDGKISIFSGKSNTMIETISASMYKVSCLVGVGDYLWAGFSNGTIMLFDPKTRPWTTRKYWQPHTHPVVTMVADSSSLWKSGRYQVLSLGVDSTIGIWDGMLEDDWIQADMQRREAEFCTYKDVTAVVMTWNAGAVKPSDLRYEQRNSNFFRDIFQEHPSPDMIVFGFQELVDLEDKKQTAKSFFKKTKQDSYGHEHLSKIYREWRDYLTKCLDECMPAEESYIQLHTASLVGLFTCVFVKTTYRARIRDLSGAEVKTGMGGVYGNKGSLVVRFVLDDTSICLTNCHLAAGQTQTVHRNQDVQAIVGSEALPPGRRADVLAGTYVHGGDGCMIMDHEICILNGDLNYRIDTMTRDTVVQAIKSKNLQKLLDRDQLLLSRRKNPDFRLRDFSEAPIDFLPTYKYDVGTDNYDSSEKRRAPAWCDRILNRGDLAVQQLSYRRHEVRVSDHRPVSASFTFRVKSRQATAYEDCRMASEQRFQAAKRTVADESKIQYLKSVFGISEQEARQLLHEQT